MKTASQDGLAKHMPFRCFDHVVARGGVGQRYWPLEYLLPKRTGFGRVERLNALDFGLNGGSIGSGGLLPPLPTNGPRHRLTPRRFLLLSQRHGTERFLPKRGFAKFPV